jgi:hypothetical protein
MVLSMNDCVMTICLHLSSDSHTHAQPGILGQASESRLVGDSDTPTLRSNRKRFRWHPTELLRNRSLDVRR